MPHPAPDQPRTEPGLPPKAASPSEAPDPGPSTPDDTPPKPGVKGALFRALVDAGANPLVAYTADEQAESMVSESVAVQVQPILANIRHQFAEHGRKLDALAEGAAQRDRQLNALAEGTAQRDRQLNALAEGAAERDRKLDALAEGAVERDRKLDTIVAEIRGLKEVIGVRADAQKRELRLIWGALGVLLTVLTVVFGFLFAG